MKALWEILIPTISNEGVPFRTRYHRVWDNKVREITGGLTVIQPVKGQWVAPNGELFKERMIPVRIVCTRAQIEVICDFTAQYYGQLAIMVVKISDEVIIKHYDRSVINQGARIAQPKEGRDAFGC